MLKIRISRIIYVENMDQAQQAALELGPDATFEEVAS